MIKVGDYIKLKHFTEKEYNIYFKSVNYHIFNYDTYNKFYENYKNKKLKVESIKDYGEYKFYGIDSNPGFWDFQVEPCKTLLHKLDKLEMLFND